MNEEKTLTIDRIQEKLSKKLIELFEFVVDEKKEFYERYPNKIPKSHGINDAISFYENQNAVISDSVGLIPGPLGMASALPEIGIIIRNQIRLIYDIGMASGKSDLLSKEALAGIFANALEPGANSLLSIQDDKVLIKKTSPEIFHKTINLIAGKITLQMQKSMTSKWLRFVGAAAMSAWSTYSTGLIGKKAEEILGREIEIVDNEINQDIDFADENEPEIDMLLLARLKILFLSNLMKIDGKVKPEELEFIEILISKSELDEATINELHGELNSADLSEVDFEAFPDSYVETIGLMIDLVALAKRDGEFHITEKEYIRLIGDKIGFAEEEILPFMDMHFPED
ncbi:MAG: hypothetical protein GY866_05440 [Proteobacteria bacterium]|nr:hypothetical protein [Pseudomonadota bacterium]